MNLIYCGSGAFASTVLKNIVKYCCIRLVITPPASPVGRKQIKQLPPAALCAQNLQVPLSHELSVETISLYQPDYIVVCDYGYKISSSILNSLPKKFINIHPSLLPRWRGAAPIERAILAGDNETGVCIMQMTSGLDAGDIFMSHKMEIEATMNAITMRNQLADKGAKMLLEVLNHPEVYLPKAQPTIGVCYASKISSNDKKLSFDCDIDIISRQLMAFTPTPGVDCYLAGEQFKIYQAQTINESHNHYPGELLAVNKEGIVIACKKGILKIIEIQRSGRKKMPLNELLRGFPLYKLIGHHC